MFSKPGGLSPRVRSYLRDPLALCLGRGSISACAELPIGGSMGGIICRVYLRVCGVTFGVVVLPLGFPGLSPRVRSYHPRNLLLLIWAGSISACAELPRGPPATASAAGVYLRVCGVTLRGDFPNLDACGLSPRVRSYRAPRGEAQAERRSISACAELPRTRSPTSRPAWVYLRVCGVTC